jgi:hypothetical protein
VGVDEVIMRSNPGRVPRLYSGAVTYKTQPHRNWRNVHDIAIEGWADCEGLAAYRSAELRVTGEDPQARVAIYETAPQMYHAVVARGDDTIEDPSRLLGMKGRPVMPRTMQEVNTWGLDWPQKAIITVGADPMPGDPRMTFRTFPHKRGHSGVLRIPLNWRHGEDDVQGACVLGVTSCCADEDEANSRGANMIRDIAAGIRSNPESLALLNPYSALGVMALQDPNTHAMLSHLGEGGKHVAEGGMGLLRRLFSR